MPEHGTQNHTSRDDGEMAIIIMMINRQVLLSPINSTVYWESILVDPHITKPQCQLMIHLIIIHDVVLLVTILNITISRRHLAIQSARCSFPLLPEKKVIKYINKYLNKLNEGRLKNYYYSYHYNIKKLLVKPHIT